MTLLRWLAILVTILALPVVAPRALAGPPRPADMPEFARAQRAIPDTPAGAKFRWLMGVLNGEPAGEPADNFTPEFLREVPPKKITAMLRDIAQSQEEGKAEGFGIDHINPGAAPTSLVAIIAALGSGNTVRVELGVDAKTGKIDFLSVTPFGGGGNGGDEPGNGPPDPLDELRKLPGRVSCFAVMLPPADHADEEPARVLSFQPDQTLAIGSAFKLWVLGAVGVEVNAGTLKWDQPVAIKNALKSLPSGDMQVQPDGATFPLAHFADKMISISDNTAADHLLFLVGRERAEAFMATCTAQPRLNQPMLSTREMFTLKLPGDPNLPLRWNVASERSRRRMLAEGGAVAKAEPVAAAALAWTKPVQVQNIEWFATTPDLCNAVHKLRTLAQSPGMDPLMHAWTINPGVPFDKNTWPRIAFKGGSEPGVLCLTWLLERDDGRTFALAMTWNDENKPVDTDRFITEARKIVDHLAQFARNGEP